MPQADQRKFYPDFPKWQVQQEKQQNLQSDWPRQVLERHNLQLDWPMQQAEMVEHQNLHPEILKQQLV